MEQNFGTKNSGYLPGISPEANALIKSFEDKLNERLRSDNFMSPYRSIEDILVMKYNLKNIESMDFPDFRSKHSFMSMGVRGNIQKAEGKILTYYEAEEIVVNAVLEGMP